MTRTAVLAGWALIVALAALSVVLDHFRMLTSHFNWFMAIQLGAVAAVSVIVMRLARRARSGGAEPDPTPAKAGAEEK